MSDKELLELAAKAAGFEYGWSDKYDCAEIWKEGDKVKRFWAPLVDDGDALRLLVAVGIDLTHCYPGVIEASYFGISEGYGLGSDPCAATRRAIVRTAAEFGRGA